MGLGILSSRPGDIKSAAFIEDISVPVEYLGEFVREMERILAEHGSEGDFYAHASAGCLHIRPLINLKLVGGRAVMRSITAQAVDLALRLKGSISGEHGVGLSRTEWLPRMYGDEIIDAFRMLKNAADPVGILNPGKILDGPDMDINLRYDDSYHASEWETVLDFSRQGGLVGAIELCNGAGVCRKTEGVMCPSFQAAGEEMHSTRGRANLLRALISGKFPDTETGEKTVYEALDLCLACKGCRSECPSAVDVAKLRYEFLNHYYRNHSHRLRDYLFARIDFFAHLGSTFQLIANPLLASPTVRRYSQSWLGLAADRVFPAFSKTPLRKQVASLTHLSHPPPSPEHPPKTCIFLSDAFTEYMYPETGLSALEVLLACGYQPVILPVIGAGRTLISKGFLEPARRLATRIIEALKEIDPGENLPVIGVEPSEIYTLRDEYLDLFPGKAQIQSLAERAYMIDEFLIRPDHSGKSRLASAKFLVELKPERVLLHGHCYQKAQPSAMDGYPTGVGATTAMLEFAGYQVSLVEAGCCGMAGAFGYEAEHYGLSMEIGELALFPALRGGAEAAWIAASGVSCQAQIKDGVSRDAFHPINLVHKRLIG
jgi:Fe-S oxidoreductase